MVGREWISEIINFDREVQRVIRRHSFDAWMGLNLTVPQLKSLFFVSNQHGSNSAKIAVALGVTPTNVTGIVDRLVEKGLIMRQQASEDRRILKLKTTDKGEAILSNLRERRVSTMRGILARMDAEKLSSLAEGLSALVTGARAYEEERIDEHD